MITDVLFVVDKVEGRTPHMDRAEVSKITNERPCRRDGVAPHCRSRLLLLAAVDPPHKHHDALLQCHFGFLSSCRRTDLLVDLLTTSQITLLFLWASTLQYKPEFVYFLLIELPF